MGQKDAFAYELELQPVYPVHLGSWNLINRLIVPVTYRKAPYAGMDDVFGLRDTTYQAFFSPAKPGEVIWDLRFSAYWNVEAPENAPDWYAEFQVKLLFPK
jgi:hypothetical protein